MKTTFRNFFPVSFTRDYQKINKSRETDEQASSRFIYIRVSE